MPRKLVGTSKDGGTFFWEINTGLQGAKSKKYPTIMKTEKESIKSTL
jgi:hypothetical protein